MKKTNVLAILTSAVLLISQNTSMAEDCSECLSTFSSIGIQDALSKEKGSKEFENMDKLAEQTLLLQEVGIFFNPGFYVSDLSEMWGEQSLIDASLLELVEMTGIGIDGHPSQSIANVTSTNMNDSIFDEESYPNIIRKLASAANVSNELLVKKTQIDWSSSSAYVEFDFRGNLYRIDPTVDEHQIDLQAVGAVASLFEGKTDDEFISVMFMNQGMAFWLYLDEDKAELLENRLDEVELYETTFTIDSTLSPVE